MTAPPSLKAPPKDEASATDTSASSLKATIGAQVSRTDVRIMIGLLSVLVMAQLFGHTSTKASTTQWEYTIESPSDSTFEMALERLGGEGWELVFARRATSEYGSASYEMIFKRPRR